MISGDDRWLLKELEREGFGENLMAMLEVLLVLLKMLRVLLLLQFEDLLLKVLYLGRMPGLKVALKAAILAAASLSSSLLLLLASANTFLSSLGVEVADEEEKEAPLWGFFLLFLSSICSTMSLWHGVIDLSSTSAASSLPALPADFIFFNFSIAKMIFFW